MDNTDIIMRLIIVSGVLALILRGRRINWRYLGIAILIIIGVTLFIDQFIL